MSLYLSEQLNRLLVAEETFKVQLNNTQTATKLKEAQTELIKHIREVGRSGDLNRIIATERAVISGDLKRYANSQSMVSSLKTALNGIAAIERHIAIVSDKAQYAAVDQAHRLAKNRKGGLPFDEARQALVSHYTRLNNMDKSRLNDAEKGIIEARKSLMFTAGKIYIERQAETLGVALGNSRKRGNHL